jgi:hypothetical protein
MFGCANWSEEYGYLGHTYIHLLWASRGQILTDTEEFKKETKRGH